MHPISLDHTSLLPASPLTMIELAADNQCALVSLRLKAPPHFDLTQDAALRRQVRAHAEKYRIGLMNTSSLRVPPGGEAPGLDAHLETSAELGARNVVFLSDEADPARRRDGFLAVCEKAAALGLGVVIEHLPYSEIRTVADAVALIGEARRERFGAKAGFLADVLHVYRSGGKISDYAAVRPEWIMHAQISDGRLAFDPDPQRLVDEARYQRMIPGEGEFALLDFVRALPDGVPMGIEVPLRDLAQRGVNFAERARRIVAGTRKVLREAGR